MKSQGFFFIYLLDEFGNEIEAEQVELTNNGHKGGYHLQQAIIDCAEKWGMDIDPSHLSDSFMLAQGISAWHYHDYNNCENCQNGEFCVEAEAFYKITFGKYAEPNHIMAL